VHADDRLVSEEGLQFDLLRGYHDNVKSTGSIHEDYYYEQDRVVGTSALVCAMI